MSDRNDYPISISSRQDPRLTPMKRLMIGQPKYMCNEIYKVVVSAHLAGHNDVVSVFKVQTQVWEGYQLVFHLKTYK